MTVSERRRRDPGARRDAIVHAAAELIVEVGVDAITHRMVAARAQVPLGSTTQYFATLDDLRAAALALLVAHVDEQMNVVRDDLSRHGTAPQPLATLLHGVLSAAPEMQADRAVVTAAIRDPKLREIAREWSRQMAQFFESDYGPERARAVAIFIDGLLWYSHIHEGPPALSTIEMALRGILTPHECSTDATA
ncbi:TetR/AcrR family transcriptional regulator [Microbacterium sp. YY-01]|uniref:TetR/AcrR family transcriptional regulator n=1 Tax=Microbacterium sp. YY-01 TaxID=3421634 RepID=UPI003D180757